MRGGTESYSGFVVKPRVVVTVAQAVFDEATLEVSGNLQWLLQRDSGTYEPAPQVPRGIYAFDGYAALRQAEGTPGTLSNNSRNLNVAAVYFVEDAGRGGYSGFLASDQAEGGVLQSGAMKMLAGYPVNGIAPANQGRLHATPPTSAALAWAFGLTYSSPAIQGLGGMLGGPLCVQRDGGSYYPAGIYVGGANAAVVRAMDSGVIDLLTRAETSGNGGDNNTSGGATLTGYPPPAGSPPQGALKVLIEPAAAALPNTGGWRLNPEDSYMGSGSQKTGQSPRTYTVTFRPLSGFETPSPVTVDVVASTLVTLTVQYVPADPDNPIIWPNPADITYGTPLSGAQLNATTKNNLDGNFAYDPPKDSKLPAGIQTLKVTFTPKDLAHNSIAGKTVALTVKQLAGKVTLDTAGLAQTYNGQPGKVTATTVPPGLNVNITYNGSAAVPVNAGTYPVVATIVDDNYTGSTAPGTLTISKGTQAITFAPPPALRGTDADYTLPATASSGLPVSYACSPATVATIVAGSSLATGAASKLHILGSGAVALTASQPGDANWNAAPPVAINLNISKSGQTMDFPAFSGHAVGDADFAPGATASSGLPVTYASDNTKVATIMSSGMIHIVGPGTAGITASQAGDARWAAVPPVKQSLTVAKGAQTITFPALPGAGYGDADFLLGTTASSGLAVAYVSSVPAVATVDAKGNVHVAAIGTTLITAKQAGNASWSPATDVTRPLTIGKGTPVLTWANPAAISYGTALTVTQLGAKASVPGAFDYDPELGAKLPAGQQTLHVIFTPTDTTHYGSAEKSVPLVVNKAVATVTITGISQTYTGQPRPVTVTTVPAGLNVNVTYAGSYNVPVNVGTYAVVATVDDPNASVPAGGPTSAKGTLTITTGTQTITFPQLANKTVGNPDFPPGATASSGLTVTYASDNIKVATIVGGYIHIVGIGKAVITASQTGNSNWKAATPVTQTLNVQAVSGVLAARAVQPDEPAIRTFYEEMRNRIEDHDPEGFLALFAPEYLHQGLLLEEQFDIQPGMLDAVKSFTFDITGITVTGDDAAVTGTARFTFTDGGADQIWLEPGANAQSRGIGWLRNSPDGWRVSGDQQHPNVSE